MATKDLNKLAAEAMRFIENQIAALEYRQKSAYVELLRGTLERMLITGAWKFLGYQRTPRRKS